MTRPVLAGVSVAERGGRLASGVAAHLLAALGASVTRLEDDAGRPLSDPPAWHRHPLLRAGKRCVKAAPGDADSAWQAIAAGAQVAIAAHLRAFPSAAPLQVLLTAFGRDGAQPSASELAVQAASGAMATTGLRGGAPCVVRAPLFEALAGLNAATSALAALRAGVRGAVLDLALIDSALALCGTFHAQALADPSRRFRQGAGHLLCSPWNAYPACDAWVVICIASDDQWPRFARCLQRDDLAGDETLRTSPARVEQALRVDAAVTAWTRERGADEVVEKLRGAGIPVSRVAAGAAAAIEAPVGLSATPLAGGGAPADSSTHAPPDAGYPRRSGCLPLAGIRLLEIGPYTAGPLAGRLLAELGAEVIKVEPPGGEDSRGWSPQVNGISTYFANYNCGKRCVELDLTSARGVRRLGELAATADVLLQNLKPGALQRFGLGPDVLRARHPGLVVCSISGYGARGAPIPALDTVVQAGSGLMSLVDAPGAPGPIRTGFSFGDLTAAHVAAFGVLAALHARERDTVGQCVDVSMHDALVWLAQFGGGAAPACAVEPHGAGFRLRIDAEEPVAVAEVAEALLGPVAQRRGVLSRVPGGAEGWPVLVSPLRWSGCAPSVGAGVGEVGADNARMAC